MEINQSNCAVSIDWRCDIALVSPGSKYSSPLDFVTWYLVAFHAYDSAMTNESGVVQL